MLVQARQKPEAGATAVAVERVVVVAVPRVFLELEAGECQRLDALAVSPARTRPGLQVDQHRREA